MLILECSQFLEVQHKWCYCTDMGTQPLGGNAVTLLVRGNITLNINIVLTENMTEFIAVVRTL